MPSDALSPEAFGTLCARLGQECGKVALAQIYSPESHAVFDATLERACRLYDTVCSDIVPEGSPSPTSEPDRGQCQGWQSHAKPQHGEMGHVDFQRQASQDSSERPALMSRQAFARALEHEGFDDCESAETFDEFWAAINRELLDVHTFHTILRLLKLHLLCGARGSSDLFAAEKIVPMLPEETGFVGVMDWNSRHCDEHYFRSPEDPLDLFLCHRARQVRMRWVHCASVARLTVLRLAVKYQLHPLPVEDSIKLHQQAVPLVRRYGDKFFIVIHLLRLTKESRAMLSKHRDFSNPERQGTSPRPQSRPRRVSHSFTDSTSFDPVDDFSQEEGPCLVQVEQGRLALFVAGPPKHDTLISVQTKWTPRRFEDGGTSGFGGEVAQQKSGRERLWSWLWPRRRNSWGQLLAQRARRFAAKGAGSASLTSDSEADGDVAAAPGTEAFDVVAREVLRDFSVLRAGNASWLLWRLLDVVVDDLSPVLAAYRARLQWYSMYISRAKAKASPDVEKQLLRSKVDLDWLQRKARPMLRVLRHLIRDKAIEPEVSRYLEDVEDHLETFIEELSRSMGICDSLREQVRSYRDRQQQNVLYVLAIVTTLFMPMQLLTGIYGMNWQDPKGHPVVPGFGPLTRDRGWYLFWGLGLMVVTGLYLMFKVILKWI